MIRRRGIHTLLAAVLIGSLGEAMMITAVPWFVLQTTGSPARTGVLLAVGAVTSGLAGVLAGPLVDRWGFRRMAVTAYLSGGAAAALVPLLHHLDRLDFPLLIGLMAAATILEVPGVAAVSGMVPGLAGTAGMPLERANSLLAGVHQGAQLFGVPLGGALAVLVGTDGVLAADAAGCLLAGAAIAFGIPRPDTTRPDTGATRTDTGRSTGPRAYLSELTTGLRTLWSHRLLRTLAGAGTAFNALDSGLSGVVLVTYAFQQLGTPLAFGALLTSFGVGMLAGTVGYAALGHRIAHRSALLGSGLAVGLLIASLAALPGLAASCALLGLLGAVAAPVGPIRASALQNGVPAPLFGRVASAVDTVGMAAVPLGASAAVLALGWLGLRGTVLAIAGCYLLVVAACWRSRSIRTLGGPAPLHDSP
ncbi:MFS transporter [Streptomyces sp. NRRL WC-3742]|uniref:MFS transporter n=1 Tax=Streptomyces sp. NRRL WC-3742 TaxID=1463934 RepID=UPI00131A7E94|nr:MFS transporter [Streptomyces sp. NRRL WC-3742]